MYNIDGHFSQFCSLNSPSILYWSVLPLHHISKSHICMDLFQGSLLFHWSARLSPANTTLFWLPSLYKKSWYLLCIFLCSLILFVVLLHFHFRITLSSSIKNSVEILASIILNYWSTGGRFDISSVVFLIVNMISLSIYLNLL